MRSASAGGNIAASFAHAAAASFFRLTSASDRTSTHTTAPPAFAIKVFSKRAGSTPSASAACMPMRATYGPQSYSCSVNATPDFVSATVAGVPLAMVRPLPHPPRREGKAARSIRVFVEHRLDRFLPRPVVLLQQFLRRRDAARDELLQRPQIARLVAPVVIEPRPPLQAGFRQPHAFARQVEHSPVADFRREARPPHDSPPPPPLLLRAALASGPLP